MTTPQRPDAATEQVPPIDPTAGQPCATTVPATAGDLPPGFEEFDLDDIEVVESKVFA